MAFHNGRRQVEYMYTAAERAKDVLLFRLVILISYRSDLSSRTLI
jgi:hypothetical protein